MEKLVLAQETSNIDNIDNSDMSSEVLREPEKKRRRIKAKKKFSSFSSDKDIADNNKENRWTQMKTLSAFPGIEQFVPVINEHIHTQFPIHKSTDNSKDILFNKTLINIAKNNDEDTNRQSKRKNFLEKILLLIGVKNSFQRMVWFYVKLIIY
ncbi:uncharacterized protein LOC116853140 isoform X2 [Odontomachus brunneus]|nr:uncharacterized protein LOC116853140 isoform X2 [Odontomachus brunneus]